MTQEEKSLLLQDLCARLPYKVKVCLYKKETCILTGIDGHEVYLNVDSDSFRIESIKPYLRPMSSMTEEEKKEWYWLQRNTIHVDCYEEGDEKTIDLPYLEDLIAWLNSHHFDYHGLIEKGLAIGVTKENNPYEIKSRR